MAGTGLEAGPLPKDSAAPSNRDVKKRISAPAVMRKSGLLQAAAGLVQRSSTPRDSLRRRLLAAADATSLLVAGLLTYILIGPERVAPGGEVLIALLPAWIVLNKLLGLYDRDDNLIHKSTLDEMPGILHSLALGCGMIFLLAPPAFGIDVDRTQTVVFGLLGALATPTLRCAVRWGIRRSCPPERILIVGSGRVAAIVARKIRAHPEYGSRLVGAVDVAQDGYLHEEGELPFMGDLERLEDVCRELAVDRVVIAFSSLSHDHLLDAIRSSKSLNLKITVVPRLFEVIGSSVAIDQIEGMTLLGLRGLSRTRSSLRLKRTIDVVGAAAGLLLLSPLLLAIAVGVKLSSPGRVLFSHMRVGRDNEPFKLFKFRTMVEGAGALRDDLAHLNEAAQPMFKIADDPRVTPLGRFLRRSSLDELPQLLNVLRGEMSLVGPRPLVPDEDDHVIGWHRSRLELTPGLTGPWQVMGRTAIPFEEMVKLDYLYVADWSLWNDIRLLLRTAPVVLGGNGR